MRHDVLLCSLASSAAACTRARQPRVGGRAGGQATWAGRAASGAARHAAGTRHGGGAAGRDQLRGRAGRTGWAPQPACRRSSSPVWRTALGILAQSKLNAYETPSLTQRPVPKERLEWAQHRRPPPSTEAAASSPPPGMPASASASVSPARQTGRTFGRGQREPRLLQASSVLQRRAVQDSPPEPPAMPPSQPARPPSSTSRPSTQSASGPPGRTPIFHYASDSRRPVRPCRPMRTRRAGTTGPGPPQRVRRGAKR
jgi:hypothetical protein